MILRWEQGQQDAKDEHPGDKWQAHLWSQLVKDPSKTIIAPDCSVI